MDFFAFALLGFPLQFPRSTSQETKYDVRWWHCVCYNICKLFGLCDAIVRLGGGSVSVSSCSDCAVSQRLDLVLLFTYGKHQRPAEHPHNVLHHLLCITSLWLFIAFGIHRNSNDMHRIYDFLLLLLVQLHWEQSMTPPSHQRTIVAARLVIIKIIH
jgi:hypothetical protein